MADEIIRHPAVPGRTRALLTPDDVHHKWFSTVRLREGYEMGDVDSFLRDVEYTIDQLFKQTEALREQVVAQAQVAQESFPESENAARIIAFADRTAQQTITEARAERTRLLGEAKQEGERIEREALLRAQRFEQDALCRAQELDRRVREQQAELESLNRSRTAVSRQLADLRILLTDYGTRLAGDLDSRLDDIERRAQEYLSPVPPPPGPSAVPAQAIGPAWQPGTAHENGTHRAVGHGQKAG